jgi:TonB family protein
MAAHAAVVGGLFAASFWQVGDLGEPPLRMPPVVVDAPAPSGGPHHPAPVAGHRQTLVAPAAAPDTLPIAGEDHPSPIDGHETGPGITGPSNGDDPTGKPGACADCPPSDGHDSRIYPVSDVKSPVALFQPSPIYPNTAGRLHLAGLVVLEAVIAADGSVEEVHALAGANPLLAQAAADAVTRWKYRPGTLNGRAVRVRLSVTVKFSLNG